MIGGLYGTAVLAHLGLGFVRRPGTGAWAADAAETGLLVAYFAVVPVVIAVGLYFPFWYSARQVARELAVEGPEPDDTDALTVVGLLAIALATAAVVAAFWLLVPNPLPGSIRFGAVAFWSVFISVIALPHVVVGSVLDRERGIWHVP